MNTDNIPPSKKANNRIKTSAKRSRLIFLISLLAALAMLALVGGMITAFADSDSPAVPQAPSAVITVTTVNQEVDSDATVPCRRPSSRPILTLARRSTRPTSMAQNHHWLHGWQRRRHIVLAPNAVYQVSGIVQDQFSPAGLSLTPPSPRPSPSRAMAPGWSASAA